MEQFERLKILDHKVNEYINNLMIVQRFIKTVKTYYSDNHLNGYMFLSLTSIKSLDDLENNKNERKDKFENQLNILLSKIESKSIYGQDLARMEDIRCRLEDAFAQFFEGEMFFHGKKKERYISKFSDDIK